MKKRSGFTLIELIAVILILGIIALIAIPTTSNVINNAKKGALQNSAYGLIEAANNLYIYNELNNSVEELTFEYDNGKIISGDDLDYRGKVPKSGSIILKEDGKVGIAIYDGKYCAVKNYDEVKVVVSDISENECTINSQTISTPETCFTFDEITQTITDYSNECTKDVVIPNKITKNGTKYDVKYIGAGAFKSKQLTSVVIPEGILEIKNGNVNNGAFASNNITSLIIPSTLKRIGNYAFQANKLTSLTISQGVETIGYAAFGYNWQLKSAVIPSSVKIIEALAFNSSGLETLILNNGLIEINGAAFDENNLVSVAIPASVTYIGDNPFSNNPNLVNILVEDNNPNFKSINNAVYTKDETTIVIGTKNMSNDIPNDVRTIYYSAFSGMGLTSLTLPPNLITICYGAFEQNPFDNVPLIIPDSVISIGAAAFRGITFGSYGFTSIKLPNNDSYQIIEWDSFRFNQITSIVVPDSVTIIESAAFEYNRLASITLPNNLVSIGNWALGNNELTTITIGKDVEIADGLMQNGNTNNNFRDTYDANNKLAGTYIGTQFGGWAKQN